MVDMKRSRCDVFLRCEKEGNAEFRQDWDRLSRLGQVLPRYKKQKKEAKSFQIRPLE
jgi:hypothetical protein